MEIILSILFFGGFWLFVIFYLWNAYTNSKSAPARKIFKREQFNYVSMLPGMTIKYVDGVRYVDKNSLEIYSNNSNGETEIHEILNTKLEVEKSGISVKIHIFKDLIPMGLIYMVRVDYDDVCYEFYTKETHPTCRILYVISKEYREFIR